jgi:hypothetical protein
MFIRTLLLEKVLEGLVLSSLLPSTTSDIALADYYIF